MHTSIHMPNRGVRIAEDTDQFLIEEAERTGTNPSEIIRRAIDLYRDRSSDVFVNFVEQAAIFFEHQNSTSRSEESLLGDK